MNVKQFNRIRGAVAAFKRSAQICSVTATKTPGLISFMYIIDGRNAVIDLTNREFVEVIEAMDVDFVYYNGFELIFETERLTIPDYLDAVNKYTLVDIICTSLCIQSIKTIHA